MSLSIAVPTRSVEGRISSATVTEIEVTGTEVTILNVDVGGAIGERLLRVYLGVTDAGVSPISALRLYGTIGGNEVLLLEDADFDTTSFFLPHTSYNGSTPHVYSLAIDESGWFAVDPRGFESLRLEADSGGTAGVHVAATLS